MTISISRAETSIYGKPSTNIRVRIAYGPIEASVVEPVDHLRHIWGELGTLLDQVEKERKEVE
jgi:hypothetical protein